MSATSHLAGTRRTLPAGDCDVDGRPQSISHVAHRFLRFTGGSILCERGCDGPKSARPSTTSMSRGGPRAAAAHAPKRPPRAPTGVHDLQRPTYRIVVTTLRRAVRILREFRADTGHLTHAAYYALSSAHLGATWRAPGQSSHCVVQCP
jgi:hypothetical protein